MRTAQDIARILGQRIAGPVHQGYPLAPHTSYHIGGPADLAVFPGSAAELLEVVRLLRDESVPLYILGGGSNVLVSDQGVRGAVVITSAMDTITRAGAMVTAAAGITSHQLALFARDAALSGAEFLSWLPGTLGGACYMNARAYGGEISQVLRQAQVITPTGELSRLDLTAVDFSYKRSPFQEQQQILVEVTLALHPGEHAAIQQRMDEIEQQRRSKHELDFPSCGCVFKNDHQIGVSSGQLIERCGLKGYRHGDAQVAPFHGNFIINLKQACADDVLQVIRHVQRTVATQTGHHLALEVQLVGQWEP